MYRLSQPLLLELLKSKIDTLTDSLEGIFGPYESVNPGEQRDGQEKEINKPFPLVSRGMGREGVGSGQGLSEQIQRGIFSFTALERTIETNALLWNRISSKICNRNSLELFANESSPHPTVFLRVRSQLHPLLFLRTLPLTLKSAFCL